MKENHCGCWACHDTAGNLDLPCGLHCVLTWEVTMTTTVNAPTAAEAMDKIEQIPWPGHVYVLGARKVTE